MQLSSLLFLCLLSSGVKTQNYTQNYDDDDYNQYPDADMLPPEIQDKYPEAPPQQTTNDWIMNHLIEVVMMAIILFLLSVVLALSCCFAELKQMVIDNNIDNNNNMEMQV